MGKAVQHTFVFTDPLNRQTIVFLIQEETCLLSVFHIYQILHSIFHNLHIGVKLWSNEVFHYWHAFFFPFFGIASLIHSDNFNSIFCQHFLQQTNYCFLHSLHTKSQTLHHQYIFIFICHQAREEIRFSKDHTAAGSIHGILSVFPGVFYSHTKERFVHFLIGFSGHHPNTDPGILIDEPAAHRISVKIMYQHDITIFECPCDRGDLIIIDPQST